ncbi:MAG: hypothetical protein J0I41_11395 [Filimonas sp.]|nr:hypothetical protein [Filimonas sp.]
MIKSEIEKQIKTGFSFQEIRDNLRRQGYSDDEIKEGLTYAKLVEADEPQPSLLPYFLSAFCLLYGLFKIATAGSEWGNWDYLVGCLLVVGGILRISYPLWRKK